MTRGLSLIRAAVLLAVVVLVALAAAFYLRDLRNPTPAATPTPAAVATSAAPSPTPTTSPVGAITGLLRYPAGGFLPALTVYAVNVADQRVVFSVATPRFIQGATPAPTPGGQFGSYTITGIAPGTYYVFAYRDSDFGGPPDLPGLYSQWGLCTRPPTTGNCTDHSLIPVTVRPGETVSGIDIADWTYNSDPNVTYPPRPATPSPSGFVLPTGCTYVGWLIVETDGTSWAFDCGPTGNRDARGMLAPALTQQGWILCGAVTATATWAKGTTRLLIAESSLSPGDYPKLTQPVRPTGTACP